MSTEYLQSLNKGRPLKRALIIFTRIPEAGRTKTRLMPYFSGEQCAELHTCFLRDISASVRNVDADVFVFYTGGKPCALNEIFGSRAQYIEQKGETLGARMHNAVRSVLGAGYESAVLIGTDIPAVSADIIEKAFNRIDDAHIVMGPTTDGGYYLIGMNTPVEEVFSLKQYGDSSVFDATVRAADDSGFRVAAVDELSDIDEAADVAFFRNEMKNSDRLRKSHTGRFLASSVKISVIIPTYNEKKTIGRMLEQIRPYRDDAEIIFVDGGSTDGTVEAIGDEFRLIKSDKGRAVQMNTAAKLSGGDVLFFVHCDSELPKDITGEIRRCMADHQYGCFGVGFHSKNFFMLTNRVISNHRAFSRGLPFGDQGIFIDREVFFDAGMFPEIPIMEDYEFGRILKSKGILPGKTRNRIYTSARRYEKGTMGILRTEYRMWNLRRKFRNGMSIDEIADRYRDIR